MSTPEGIRISNKHRSYVSENPSKQKKHRRNQAVDGSFIRNKKGAPKRPFSSTQLRVLEISGELSLDANIRNVVTIGEIGDFERYTGLQLQPVTI